MNHEALLALLAELYANLSVANTKLQAATVRITELETATKKEVVVSE